MALEAPRQSAIAAGFNGMGASFVYLRAKYGLSVAGFLPPRTRA
jgi:hypothetical protein